MNLLRYFSITLLSGSLYAAPVYETLEYGDSKDTVIEKLTECPRIEGEYVVSMFGNSKLDESFKVAQPLAGSQFSLSFDWDDTEGLNRIDLRSDQYESAAYNTELKNTFDAAVRLISRLYGKPAIENSMPPADKVKTAGVTASHVWQIDEGSLILGIGESEGKYDVLIRFSQKRVGQ
jgi:hypothetical protein